jgi:hypothetical protein
MANVETRLFRYFVAQEQYFARAAANLEISRPTASLKSASGRALIKFVRHHSQQS